MEPVSGCAVNEHGGGGSGAGPAGPHATVAPLPHRQLHERLLQVGQQPLCLGLEGLSLLQREGWLWVPAGNTARSATFCQPWRIQIGSTPTALACMGLKCSAKHVPALAQLEPGEGGAVMPIVTKAMPTLSTSMLDSKDASTVTACCCTAMSPSRTDCDNVRQQGRCGLAHSAPPRSPVSV